MGAPPGDCNMLDQAHERLSALILSGLIALPLISCQQREIIVVEKASQAEATDLGWEH